jgi:hypothetical protein
VAKLGGEAGFEKEAALEGRVLLCREIGVENFERHHPVERRLVGLVDLPHSTGAERLDDAEAAVEDSANQRISSGKHRCGRALGIALEHGMVTPKGKLESEDDDGATNR